jgi:Predicted pyridoxal phosphate-dependent enzyme apparently involved in regulation of cell wall biogenesis
LAEPTSLGAATSAIPFNRSSLQGQEIDHMRQSVSIGQIAGDQSYSRKCQTLLQEVLGAPKVLLTTSCTHALELAALLLDIGPDDEVIVPSFTFVSTANAFVLRGARIRFADIRPDTLNIDEKQIEPLITPRTRAMVPVHYAGVGCEMDTLSAIARAHRIAIVKTTPTACLGNTSSAGWEP